MGEGSPTDKLLQYEVYQKMLNGKDPETFEDEVKTKFKKEPAKMKLLIVVDKLLTGFDAPSATYLYIDKNMQDHGLFQAICRVNRVDGDDKKYGYIIDYKDLFKSLKKSISDYTSGAFDDYDTGDVEGLLTSRLEKSKEDLDTALEAVRTLCEPVHPKDEPNFIRFFCGNTENRNDLQETEHKRVTLYKTTSSLVRAYANLANEMEKAGYTAAQAEKIKEEVRFYGDLRDTIKRASGDYVDLKRFEPSMRQLMDMYLDANSSKKISNFENKGLVQIILQAEEDAEEYTTENERKKREAVAETIENNMRKVIIEESATNPKYFEKMSRLLDELIQQRKAAVIEYKAYLDKMAELAEKVEQIDNSSSGDYPRSLTTKAKRALYDNLEKNEILALAVDNVIQNTKQDDWRSHKIKEKRIMLAINGLIQDEERTKALMKIVEAQHGYY